MFHRPPPSTAFIPNRKRIHQHHESQKWIRIPVNQVCLECYPVRKPFLETAFCKIPPEIREDIFKKVLTVGSISPLKDGISVRMTKTKHGSSKRGSKTKPSIGPAKPASCLALLQTCRQIYHESSLLFYSINTLYLSSTREMLSFLCHLGQLRCDKLRSLHFEDVLESAPMFDQLHLDQLCSMGTLPENTLARFATRLEDIVYLDVIKGVRLINKLGNIQKLYLDMRPSQVLGYIKLCTQIPGFEHSEIVFESPTRWSVMTPSTTWEKRSWFTTFLIDYVKESPSAVRYCPYWRGNEKYRVEVDVLRALPEGRSAAMDNDRSGDASIRDDSSMDTAMESLPKSLIYLGNVAF